MVEVVEVLVVVVVALVIVVVEVVVVVNMSVREGRVVELIPVAEPTLVVVTWQLPQKRP